MKLHILALGSTLLTACDHAVPPSSAVDAAVLLDATASNRACVRTEQCDPGETCQGGSGCGAGAAGVCRGAPVDCQGQYQPVCSCDQRAFDSVCHLQQAGALLATSQPCSSSACGACPAGRFCYDCGSGGPQCLTPPGQCARP